MFQQRYSPIGSIVYALKSVVDWIFPGALWSWEGLGAFFFGCILVAFVAYAVAAWACTRPAPGLSLWWIFGPLLVFQISLIVGPASMTTDIYNYAIYGEMPVLYGANPFIRTPGEFPQSPLYYLIPLYWHDAPSVYGPVWIAISTGVAALFRNGPLADELLAYRLIANVAHLLNAVLVWRLATRLDPGRAKSAFVAYAWNPLLLVDFCLNGHNDVLMLTFALLALLLTAMQRTTSAALALGLSIATKYTSVLLTPLILFWSARQEPDRKAQIRVLSIGALAVAAPLVLFYLPWIEGIDTFGPVLYWTTGPRLNNYWPEPLLISVTSWISGPTGIAYEAVWPWVLDGFKLLAKVGFAAYVLIEAIRIRSIQGLLRSAARVMLVFLLLVNTWVMPWYYTWPLAFAAALGWHDRMVRVCAAFTLTAMLLMYQRQYGHTFLGDWGGGTLILPVLVVAAVVVCRHLAVTLRSPRPSPPAPQPPAPIGRTAAPTSSQSG
jgi:alpha-1,6-mannosyltransferase